MIMHVLYLLESNEVVLHSTEFNNRTVLLQRQEVTIIHFNHD